MIVKINDIYEKIGLLALQNLKIGTDNKLNDFNFYKLSQIEKILSLKNIDWNRLSKTKEELIFIIDDLNII